MLEECEYCHVQESPSKMTYIKHQGVIHKYCANCGFRYYSNFIKEMPKARAKDPGNRDSSDMKELIRKWNLFHKNNR